MTCAGYHLSITGSAKSGSTCAIRDIVRSIVSKSQFRHALCQKTMCFIDIKTGGITGFLYVHRLQRGVKVCFTPADTRGLSNGRSVPKVQVREVAVHAPTQPGSGISGRQRLKGTYRYRAVPFFFSFILNARSKHFITLNRNTFLRRLFLLSLSHSLSLFPLFVYLSHILLAAVCRATEIRMTA